MPFNLLVISDSANNRLVVVNEETMECVYTIGNGKVGLVDGSYRETQFHHPQGMCHIYREGSHFIYVCDTKNHAIREVNLRKHEVLTVIGTGEKGYDKEGNKSAETQRLSSPWDVVAVNRDTLVFAMAGTHQIWALNLKTNRAFNFSGSGKEGNLNHKSDIKLCEWAQPSGLSIGLISQNHIELYVADSESSSIRAVNMKTLTSSRNVIGGDANPKNLHCFGDKDGVSYDAKLQHPLGVHFIPEKNVILIADTYNHKVKVLDPFRNEVFSWLGGADKPTLSLKDGTTSQSAFNEPQGIASLFDEQQQDVKVYICDTNNHCIRSCYYDVGSITTLQIKGIPLPTIEFHDKNAINDIAAKKREVAAGATDQTNLRCEGDQCFYDDHN